MLFVVDGDPEAVSSSIDSINQYIIVVDSESDVFNSS